MTDARLVLVADDEADIRKLIGVRLGRLGYEVVTANDGEAALARARERVPDLVIIDVRMPKLSGLDVVRELRRDEATRAVPVIMVTASVEEENLARGLEAGAQEVVRKPFRPEELLAHVERLLADG